MHVVPAAAVAWSHMFNCIFNWPDWIKEMKSSEEDGHKRLGHWAEIVVDVEYWE